MVDSSEQFAYTVYMMNETTNTMKTFEFYTYDAYGKDAIIPVDARNEDEAYYTFIDLYGSGAVIDMIVEAKGAK